jgi:hypothetical protein
LCYRETTDDTTEPVTDAFLIGTIESTVEYRSFAYIQQVNLTKMELGWRRAIHGTVFPPTNEEGVGPNIHGIACTVTRNGKDVYVAGNIMDGTILIGDEGNNRRRRLRQSNPNVNVAGDIFVARLDAADGTMIYSREIGSDYGNDAIAPGKSLATDAEGNLIVLANTQGSLYHQNVSPEGSSEFVVFSVGRAKGDYFPPHPRSQDHESNETPQMKSHDKHEKLLFATYALLALLFIVSIVVVSLHLRYRRTGKRRYQSGLYKYEGIWRTAAFDAGRAGNDKLILTGRLSDRRREQRYSDIDRARRLSSSVNSATKFPLGSFSDNRKGEGNVYDLLAMASERHSKVLADDQARARERLAQAVRAATSHDEDDIPDISK